MATKASILVVDDEPMARQALCSMLELGGYDVNGVGDGEAALDAARQQRFSVCISDIRMPGIGGIELLRRLRHVSPGTLVLLVTGYGDMETAVAALREGASDYLHKPFDFDELVGKVRSLVEGHDLEKELRHQRLAQQAGIGPWLRGPSAVMQEVRRRIIDVAARPCHLLITGEEGTGRRQAARAVHEAGLAEGHWLELDAAELKPESLRETGDWLSYFERANRGTLYLAHIDALDHELQKTLAAALERAVQSHNGDPSPIDARVIATAGGDLEARVGAHLFHRRLYESLAVEQIAVPPLRRRLVDISVLIGLLSDTHITTSESALQHCLGYHWPGNVAELAAVVETAVASDTVTIELPHLPAAVRAAPSLAPADLLPEKIGAYRIEGRLGTGGMSSVYRAWDELLERPVAIKRVSPERDDPGMRSRLYREARAVAKLNHPSIVQIYHLFEEDRHGHIVMELVDGDSLALRLLQGALEVPLAVDLTCDIAAGLAEAHREGIIHRDLKASNVIVTPTSRAKILDFGLAKRFGPEEDTTNVLTAVGDILGTVHAMSPEQVLGKDIDQRSDLFALGILLFEMLIGQRPFTGTAPMRVLYAICTNHPADLRDLDPEIPVELADLVNRLLEKDPDNRPQTADEVLETLSEHRQDESQPHEALAAAAPPADLPGWRRLLGRLHQALG